MISIVIELLFSYIVKKESIDLLYDIYWFYSERMGKIEGGEERFLKIKFSPIHKIYIEYRHINLIIILRNFT